VKQQAPPNCKLPIFYLTDSILKNVRGPYGALLARNIVPLYCNCVKQVRFLPLGRDNFNAIGNILFSCQVSGKDLRRFVHVLNTWDQTRLFPADSLAQMRTAANRAMAAAGEPVAAVSQPTVSFANEPRRAPPPAAAPQQPSQHDMELRSLLTHMQNDMGIHPTEHLSLEQVRVQNPEWYNQLVEYHAASKLPAVDPVPPVNERAGLLSAPVGPPPVQAVAAQPPAQPVRPAPRQPRRTRFSDVAPPGVLPHPGARAGPPPPPPAKSANVAHLMDLLNRKKAAAPVPASQPHEITNDHPRGSTPNAAAVMSILQKLKGLNGQAPAAPPTQAAGAPSGGASPASEQSASKMWFSDKIVAHKDRVESNVQKLYAALPLVCRESGLRFKEQEKMNAHLDFLFQYNRSQKERGKGGVSRSWYPDEDQWVMDYSGEAAPREATSSSFFDRKNDVEQETTDQFETARVPVDEAVTRCRICGCVVSDNHFRISIDLLISPWCCCLCVVKTSSRAGTKRKKTGCTRMPSMA
jgi:hypothetical protein